MPVGKRGVGNLLHWSAPPLQAEVKRMWQLRLMMDHPFFGAIALFPVFLKSATVPLSGIPCVNSYLGHGCAEPVCKEAGG